MAEREPSAEELAEQIRRLKVSDVLVSSVATIGQLGYAKLDPSARDLDDARLAIEAIRVLLPVLERSLEERAVGELSSLLASLQLAYASAAAEGGATAGGDEEAAPDAS